MESVILVMLAWCESRGLGANRVGLRNQVCNSLNCGLSNGERLNCCSESWEAGGLNELFVRIEFLLWCCDWRCSE